MRRWQCSSNVVDVARNLNAPELQLPFAIQTRFPVIALVQNRAMGQRGTTARCNQQTELPLVVCCTYLTTYQSTRNSPGMSRWAHNPAPPDVGISDGSAWAALARH